jgi:Domain of unknown function (DUF5615)
MRFVIDNNLSPLLAERLKAAGHDVVHVRDIGVPAVLVAVKIGVTVPASSLRTYDAAADRPATAAPAAPVRCWGWPNIRGSQVTAETATTAAVTRTAAILASHRCRRRRRASRNRACAAPVPAEPGPPGGAISERMPRLARRAT